MSLQFLIPVTLLLHSLRPPPPRRRGEEPPEGHPHRYRILPPDLLRGVLWRLRRPHPHDAVLPAGQQQPLACGL